MLSTSRIDYFCVILFACIFTDRPSFRIMALMSPILFLLATAAHAANPQAESLQMRLEAALTPIVDELGLHYNTSIQYGFRQGDTLVSLAAGPEDRATGAPILLPRSMMCPS